MACAHLPIHSSPWRRPRPPQEGCGTVPSAGWRLAGASAKSHHALRSVPRKSALAWPTRGSRDVRIRSHSPIPCRPQGSRNPAICNVASICRPTSPPSTSPICPVRTAIRCLTDTSSATASPTRAARCGAYSARTPWSRRTCSSTTTASARAARWSTSPSRRTSSSSSGHRVAHDSPTFYGKKPSSHRTS